MPQDLNHKLYYEMMQGNIETVRLMLNQGVEVNYRDDYGNTPLHHAAEKGDRAFVHLLLEYGAEVNAITNQGETVLWKAAHNRNIELIPLLLQAGEEPSFADAALLGDVEAGRRWIQAGADIHSPIWYRDTPLRIACGQGHLDFVRMLIEFGVEVRDDYPSILQSVVYSGSFALLQLLLKTRIWEEERLFNGLTAAIDADQSEMTQLLTSHIQNLTAYEDYVLEFALWGKIVLFLFQSGMPLQNQEKLLQGALEEQISNLGSQNIEVVRALIAYGADVSQYLPIAVGEELSINMIRLLLDHDADRNATDHLGNTAMQNAQQRGDPEIVRLLIEAGCPLDLESALILGDREQLIALLDTSSVTQTDLNISLWRAVREGKKEIVSLLLNRGADPNEANQEEETALWKAIQYGQTEIYHLLLKHGADIRPKSRGMTLLHWAVIHYQSKIAKDLLERGVPPEALDEHGYTAFGWADSSNRQDLAALIKDYTEMEKHAKDPFTA